MNTLTHNNLVKAITEQYPQVDWDRFEDADRALNWELWHGPLPGNYWTYVEPLEHYVWNGWQQAQKDIEEMLDPLPQTLYYSPDCDLISDSTGEDDQSNWAFPCEHCGEFVVTTGDRSWVTIYDDDEKCAAAADGHEPDYSSGSAYFTGIEFMEIDPRKELMYEETFRQVF